MEEVIKVRFNLGKGDNYKKWQVKSDTTKHYEPKKTRLTLHNARLMNNRKSAEKIFNGHNKFVCAWIECERIEIEKAGLSLRLTNIAQVRYNPRKFPYWVSTFKNTNVDGEKYAKLVTMGTDIYILEK